MVKNNDITSIRVTYNSAHIIGDALSRADKRYPMIIVDNASSDKTCAEIKRLKRPNTKVIRNKKNLGFGTANNIALKACKTRYALMLNPDAVIEHADIQKLKAALEADDKAVMAGPMIDGPTISKRGTVSYRIQPYSILHKKNPLFPPAFRRLFGRAPRAPRIFNLRRNYECGFVSGAIMIYDLRKMPQLLYFDEDLFLYFEETDLQARIVAAGYKVLVELRAFATHQEQASSKFASEAKRLYSLYYHNSRSRHILAVKYGARISKIDIMAHAGLNSMHLFLCNLGVKKDCIKYEAERQGFRDGYKKDRSWKKLY